MFYRAADIVFAVYDLSSVKESLQELEKEIDLVLEAAAQCAIILIGNKVDLQVNEKVSANAQASINRILAKYTENIILHLETSAKTGQNVKAMCTAIVELVGSVPKGYQIKQETKEKREPLQSCAVLNCKI